MSVNTTVASTRSGSTWRAPVEELLDLPDDRFGVADIEEVVGTGQLNQAGTGDVLGQVAAVLDVDHGVAGAVDHERGCLYATERVADVDGMKHPPRGHAGARAGREPQEAGELVRELRIAIGARQAQPEAGAPSH